MNTNVVGGARPWCDSGGPPGSRPALCRAAQPRASGPCRALRDTNRWRGRADPHGRDPTGDLHTLVALACERFGRLDVLISNAGAGTISPLDDLRVDEWDQMVDVNVKGVLHGIGAALPVFRAQGTGHFITIASTAAFRIVPTMAVYAGTKFAVRAICEGLRQEADDSLR